MNRFKTAIDSLLDLYSEEKSKLIKRTGMICESSSKKMDVIEDSIRRIGTEYITSFCDDEKISTSGIYLTFLRKIIEEIRTVIWFPVQKKNAKRLHITMDLERKVIPI